VNLLRPPNYLCKARFLLYRYVQHDQAGLANFQGPLNQLLTTGYSKVDSLKFRTSADYYKKIVYSKVSIEF
jgi:hypothetical protein